MVETRSGSIRCGVFLPLVGHDRASLLAHARRIEELAFDSLWVDDHFWFPGAPERDHLEAWTVLSMLAAVTRRLRLGPLVACPSYRSPAMLAKIAASLSRLSEGRLTLGIGAGWMQEEYLAHGIPFPSPGVRLAQLDEALEAMRRLWSGETVRFDGVHHRLHDARHLPTPLDLPVVIGGAGDRLLGIVARRADGWNCPNTAWRELAEKRDRLWRLCERIGRDPAAIEISEQVIVVVAPDERGLPAARARAERAIGAFANLDEDVHLGTPAMVAESLRARASLGVRLFTVMFGDLGSDEQVDLFGREVLPLLG